MKSRALFLPPELPFSLELGRVVLVLSYGSCIISCCTRVTSCFLVFYLCCVVLCHVVLVLSCLVLYSCCVVMARVVLVLGCVASCCYLCSFLDEIVFFSSVKGVYNIEMYFKQFFTYLERTSTFIISIFRTI